MPSPRFRPLGVEPIEDRILLSGFGFHEPPHQFAGGRDPGPTDTRAFDSRTFDGGSHHPPPPGDFSRDAPAAGPTSDFGSPPPPPPSGGPGFPSGPVAPGPGPGGGGGTVAPTPPGGTTASVSSPSSPSVPNSPAQAGPTPAAVPAMTSQSPPRGTPGFLAPDSAGRVVAAATTGGAATSPGTDPAADPGVTGPVATPNGVPELAAGSPPQADAAESAGRAHAAIAGVSNLRVGIAFAEAVPIVVDLPGGTAVAGLLGLDAPALEDGVRGVLDRVAAIVCEPPEGGEGRDWEAWLATAAVLSGWAGYALWSNRKARRSAQLAAGSGSVSVRPGG